MHSAIQNGMINAADAAGVKNKEYKMGNES
jgi:hypothetical protein